MTRSPRPAHALRRLVSGALIALVALVALAAPAAAHADADATPATAGRTSITFTFGHGCDGAPTTVFRVEIPEGATDTRPQDSPGWSSTVEPDQVLWTGGSIPESGSFTVEMVLAQPVGATVVVPVIQECPGGLEEAWIQLPDGRGTEPAMPAPSFVVPANDTVPTTAATTATTATTTVAAASTDTTARMQIEQTPITVEGSETNTSGLIIFVIAVGAIVIGAIVLFLRHRGQGTNSAPRP
jgi:uncharacterized protein YcnI